MKPYIGICIDCKDEKLIINSKGRCADCQYIKNNGISRYERYREKQKIKVNKIYKLKRKFLKTSKNDKREEVLKKDELVYEEVFNLKKPFCENCHRKLNNIFRDEEGNIIARYQYSHILTKGGFPLLRHNVKNFNRLCLNCHYIWEFGDRENMRIFVQNEEIREELLREMRKL